MAPTAECFHQVLVFKSNYLCSHCRFLPLLAKCDETDSSLTPLPFVMKLLISKNVNSKVVDMIIEIVECLLITEDFEESTEEGKALDVGHCVEVTNDSKCPQVVSLESLKQIV